MEHWVDGRSYVSDKRRKKGIWKKLPQRNKYRHICIGNRCRFGVLSLSLYCIYSAKCRISSLNIFPWPLKINGAGVEGTRVGTLSDPLLFLTYFFYLSTSRRRYFQVGRMKIVLSCIFVKILRWYPSKNKIGHLKCSDDQPGRPKTDWVIIKGNINLKNRLLLVGNRVQISIGCRI